MLLLGQAEERDEQVGLGEGRGGSGWPGETTIQQSPPLFSFLGRFSASPLSLVEVDRGPQRPAFSSEGGFCCPLLVLSPPRSHGGPPQSLSHASHSFLEGKLGAPRESRWSEPGEAPSWLYSPGVGDRPTGCGSSTVCARSEKAGDGTAHL